MLWGNEICLRPNKNYLDFLGVNYYRRQTISFTEIAWRRLPRCSSEVGNKNFCSLHARNDRESDMGWEIYPKGIYQILRRLRKYHLPIYITENGLADVSDQKRWSYIREHLVWLYQAIAKGVDVRGYFYWSLMDNSEWVDGFEPRFGLLAIDYWTLERRVRASAWQYAKVCQAGQLVVCRNPPSQPPPLITKGEGKE